ncbi:MAG: hypothetical protein LJE84_01845 [Gammaproteobacteria bacterium]|jgi:hypothetical protein|nr:hypothetical protein [Gammaproteobacteria bacterium]
MRKLTLLAAAAVGVLALGGVLASTEGPHTGHGLHSDASIELTNPASWFANAPQPGSTMVFNPARPEGWAVIVDPNSHTAWHMAFTNPANYAQFLKPDFFLEFLKPENLMAWMNPASYAVFMDPNTWLYWMTPQAYVHALNPANYLQPFQLDNYAAFIDTGTYAGWSQAATYSEVLGQTTGTASARAPATPAKTAKKEEGYLSRWFGGKDDAN